MQVSTKLNRSHTVPGEVGVILPCKGRTDLDVQAGGPQHVSVEDSMGMVHASRGHLDPPAPDLPSEVEVISRAGPAPGARPAPTVDWERPRRPTTARIRDHISRVVPGFEDYDARVEAEGFTLPNPARDSRTFPTATGRARFTVNPLELARGARRGACCSRRSAATTSTTPPSTGSTTATAASTRDGGWCSPTPTTWPTLGWSDGDVVDVVSVWDGGERRAPAFRLVAYPAARGTCAAYFPEANVLVPLDSTADVSGTPTSKSVIVRFEAAAPAGP